MSPLSQFTSRRNRELTKLPVDNGETLNVHSPLQQLVAYALDTASTPIERTNNEARFLPPSILAKACTPDDMSATTRPGGSLMQTNTDPGVERPGSSSVTSPTTSTLAVTGNSTSGAA